MKSPVIFSNEPKPDLEYMKKHLKRSRIITEPFRVAVTGHRYFTNTPKALQSVYRGAENLVYLLSKHFCLDRTEIAFIHGTASGVDVAFGRVALQMNIPLELYLPFPYSEQRLLSKWTETEDRSMKKQMQKAEKVVVVNQSYSTYGYQKRNIEMVNKCSMLATAYTRTRSGSGNCHRYAAKVGRICVDLFRLDGLGRDVLDRPETVFELFY